MSSPEEQITVRRRPCTSCPYRRDVPSGVWHPDEYDKLPGYDGDVLEQFAAGATGLFFCHQLSGEVCAGWAGCHDMANSLAMRMNAARIDPAVYDYQSPIPLFGSGAEAAEHGKRGVAAPDAAAARVIRTVRRIQSRRTDR